MKIILAINNPVPWDKMNHELFQTQRNPFIEGLVKFIEAWDKVAQVPFFEFRNDLSNIALKNWMRLPDVVVVRSVAEIQDAATGEFILLICDDDDWYAPHLTVHPDEHVVAWEPIAFTSAALYPNKPFTEPFFDFGRRGSRPIYSNNWYMTKKGYESLTPRQRSRLFRNLDGRWASRDEDLSVEERKLLQTNLIANEVFKDRVHMTSDQFNLANKTIVSTTAMLQIGGSEARLVAGVKLALADLEVPAGLSWASEEISATRDLYRAAFNL